MGKTFYWVGGATGANALSPYNWNNPKNWIVENSGLATSLVSGSTAKGANRFNLNTGAVGAVTDESVTYCPGIGDVAIIGDLPKIGNAPKQVKAPLLFGGCGITSGTGPSQHTTWVGAQVASGTGQNIGLATINIRNRFVDGSTTEAVYPFAWIGGGVSTERNPDLLAYLLLEGPIDANLLNSADAQDLRLIVRDEVNVDSRVGFTSSAPDTPVRCNLLFKAGVKKTVGGLNVVKTVLKDTSTHIALGIYDGKFDGVEIKKKNDNDVSYPTTRFLYFVNCRLNDVLMEDYAGGFLFDYSTKVNNVVVTSPSWYGSMKDSLGETVNQTFTFECTFDGPSVRTELGYSGVDPSVVSTLSVGKPFGVWSGGNAGEPYAVQYPPTITLGTEPSVSLLGEEQIIRTVEVNGLDYDDFNFVDARWHISFKGNTNIKYLKSSYGILKANPLCPVNANIKIGNAELSNHSEITFTKNCPIVDAGDQDVWYFGAMTDTLRGGLKFKDSTGLVYGGKNIVMANSYENEGKDTVSGQVDYDLADITATTETQA
jgi:hypothetical protein